MENYSHKPTRLRAIAVGFLVFCGFMTIVSGLSMVFTSKEASNWLNIIGVTVSIVSAIKVTRYYSTKLNKRDAEKAKSSSLV